MFPVAKLEYVLPEELIATEPAVPRDAARMMVISRSDPAFVRHALVRDLPDFLSAGDMLVVNASKVIPACIAGKRADTGGKVEGLFLGIEPDKQVVFGDAAGGCEPRGAERWRVMLKGRRMRAGIFVGLTDGAGNNAGVSLKLIERTRADVMPKNGHGPGPAKHEDEGHSEPDQDAWLVEVYAAGVEAALHKRGQLPLGLLERIGTTPLPPYIRAARRRDAGTFGEHGGEASLPIAQLAARDELDRQRYQTVYADGGAPGSVAAPTAGLHFTPELLERLTASGVRREQVVLHVGTGTFKPIEAEYLEQHPMHAEWCCVPRVTGSAVMQTRGRGRRVIAVGTTSARTLESFGSEVLDADAAGWTRLLIVPGWRYQHLYGMMTNFHLPRSTLLAMVGAMLPEGVERLLAHYREAIDRRYRFYSYGDAMLILP